MNNPTAYIVTDGSSYYGIYANELEDEQALNPDVRVVEEHSYWSDYMEQRIIDLNNNL